VSRVARHVASARERSLERALRDERRALVSVAAVALRAARDPDELVARLEVIARRAVEQPRNPARTCEALTYASRAFANARAIELGKPQRLFDLDVGHVAPGGVRNLIDGADPGQTSLFEPEVVLGLADGAAEELLELVVDVFRDADEPLDDAELRTRVRCARPLLTAAAIARSRVELVRRGRLVVVGPGRHDLPERTLA
jgi:hypothetical protein